jgi:hypothetical protein
VTPRQLLAWDALARRRRSALPWWLPALLAGIPGVAVHVAAGREAPGFWRLALAAAAAVLVMGGPWRLFWRRDAKLLGLLPIPGPALYRLSAWATLRAAASVWVALVIADLPVALAAPADFARAAGLAGLVVAAAAAAAPALTALAGAIVISAKAQAVVRDVAGGDLAPGITWLSALPAAGGFGAGWLAWEASIPVAAAALAAAAALYLLAARMTGARLGEATREIAALDAVKLAHVDLSRARGLERAAGRVGAGPPGTPARLIYDKDVALARRRYPGHYLLSGIGILAMLAAALFARGATRRQIVGGCAVGLVAYLVVHARRLWAPPVEHPAWLRTLPLPEAGVRRGKRAHVGWRAVWVGAFVLVAVALTVAR